MKTTNEITNIPNGLIETLRDYQQQIDEDGVMIGVSRQAVDEAVAILSALTSKEAGDGWKQGQYSYQQIFNAISAATSIAGGGVAISVKKFEEAMLAASPQPQNHSEDVRGDHIADAGNMMQAAANPLGDVEQPSAQDYEEVLADHRQLVRELDVLLNGEEGAAKQASLCDVVAQVRRQGVRIAQEQPEAKACNADNPTDMEPVASVVAFAQEIMSIWPYGDVDGGQLQDIAEKHGLITPETRHESCGDEFGSGCNCAGSVLPEEWEAGITCYRKARILVEPYRGTLSPTASQAVRMAAYAVRNVYAKSTQSADEAGTLMDAALAIEALIPVSQGDSPSAFEVDQRKQPDDYIARVVEAVDAADARRYRYFRGLALGMYKNRKAAIKAYDKACDAAIAQNGKE